MENLIIGLLSFISLLFVLLFIQSKKEKILDFFSLCDCLLRAVALIIFGVVYLALKKTTLFVFKFFFNIIYFIFNIPQKIKSFIKYIDGEKVSVYGVLVSIDDQEIDIIYISDNQYIPTEITETFYKKLTVKSFKNNLLDILIPLNKFSELKIKIGDEIKGWKCKKFPYDEELDFISTS